ncbi:MAG: acetylglutamate kinase [Acidobacteriota bacterium]
MKKLAVGGWRLAVVKLGGSLLDDSSRREAALEKIAERWHAGEQIVLVHGGGKHIDAALTRAGIAKKTHAGLRITDDATLEIVVSVLAGSVNKMLVSELTKLGVRAGGMSGCDGATLVAEQHPPIDGVDLGHVGQVTHANRGMIRALLTSGVMPVISSVAIGEDGALFNVNADTAAAAIAAALNANELRFLTDVEGLLDANGDVVPRLHAADVETFIESVTGGMKPKLQAALNALRQGVAEVTIGAPTTGRRQTTLAQPPTEGGTTLVAA